MPQSPASAQPPTRVPASPACAQTPPTGFTSAKVSRFYFHMHYFIYWNMFHGHLHFFVFFFSLSLYPPLSVFVFLSVAHARTHTYTPFRTPWSALALCSSDPENTTISKPHPCRPTLSLLLLCRGHSHRGAARGWQLPLSIPLTASLAGVGATRRGQNVPRDSLSLIFIFHAAYMFLQEFK